MLLQCARVVPAAVSLQRTVVGYNAATVPVCVLPMMTLTSIYLNCDVTYFIAEAIDILLTYHVRSYFSACY